MGTDHSAEFSAAFHDSHDRSLVLPASSGNPALTFAQVHIAGLPADESLVNFNFSAEFASEEIILQGQPDAVKHEPCGLLSNIQSAGNLVAADPILAVSKHPRCRKPLVQTDRAVLVDRADLDGELALSMMAAALPYAALWIEAYLLRAASWAGHATRPATHSKVVNAVVGIREIQDCFLKRFRFLAHGVHHEQKLA